MADTLKPQSGADRQFVLLLEGGDLNLELVRQELERRTRSTHAVVAGAVPEAVIADESAAEAIKEEPLTAMSFVELSALLTPKGVDLQKQLDDHVGFMVRMGTIEVDKADAYRAKFQTISVRKGELENIPQGYKPMLFVDDKTPSQSAKAFDI